MEGGGRERKGGREGLVWDCINTRYSRWQIKHRKKIILVESRA